VRKEQIITFIIGTLIFVSGFFVAQPANAGWQDVSVGWATPHCYSNNKIYDSSTYYCPSGTTKFKIYHRIATESGYDYYHIYSGSHVVASALSGCLTGGSCGSNVCSSPYYAWSSEYTYYGGVSFRIVTDGSVVYYGAYISKISCYTEEAEPTNCAQAGCGNYASGGSCYCDSSCVDYGDCCYDACSVCGYCSCTPNDYRSCYGGDAYWYDSCGNRGSLADDCTSCEYCYYGYCYNNCSGSDTSCGCTSCSNCNSSDGCVGTTYRDYYCSGTSCTYSSSYNDSRCLKSQGETCSYSSECQSGYCVDGYCCNSSCSGDCRSCAMSGYEGSCRCYYSGDDPESDCYGTGTCGGTCNGSCGCQYPSTSVTCSSLQDCDYLNYYYQLGTQSPTATEYCYYRDYADTYRYCNGSGSCATLNCSYSNSLKYSCGTCKYISSSNCTDGTQGSCTNYSQGTSCGTDKECDGNGSCKNCADPTVTISPSKTTVDPGETFTITVTGTDDYDVWHCYVKEDAGTWQSQQCIGSQTTCAKGWNFTKSTPGTYTYYGKVVDSDDVNGCADYHWSSVKSVTVTVSKKPNGTSCTAGSQCQSGYCVDGYCCNQACNTTCTHCNATPGTCIYITAGTDPDSECYGTGTCGGTCNGSGSCQYPSTSVTCSSLQDCDYLNYYYQDPSADSAVGTDKCYYRDYVDTYRYCNGAGSCSALNCSSYSNPYQYECGTCKYIPSNYCVGDYKGSCANWSQGGSCGTNKECDGSGSCVDCAPPSGTISASKTTVDTDEQFTITVNGYDDNDVWYLYVKEDDGSWQSQQCLFTQTSCAKTWNFTKTTAGTYKYYGWVIDSDDVHGCSAYHESATVPTYVTVTVNPAVCSASDGLTCSGQSAHAINLSWNALSGATNYRVEWCNASYSFGDANCCSGTCYAVTSDTSYYIYGLNIGTSYKFRVRVDSASGCTTPGVWSSIKQCATTAQDLVDCNNECYRRGYVYQGDCYPLIGGYIPCGQSQTNYGDPIGKYGACSGLFVGGCVCCHNCPSSPPSDYVTVGSCNTTITGKGWDATDGVIFGYRHLDKDTTWRKFSMDDNPGDSTCGDNLELQNSWSVSGDTITVQTDVLGKSATHSLGGGFNFNPGACKYTVSKIGVAGNGNETYTSTGACMTGTNALGVTGGADPGEYVRWLIDLEYCGDGECNCGETCTSCETDCGSCDDVDPTANIEIEKNGSPVEKEYLKEGSYTAEFTDDDNLGVDNLDICTYTILRKNESGTWETKAGDVPRTCGSFSLSIPAGSYPYDREGYTVLIYSDVKDKAGNSKFSYKGLKFDFTPPTTDID